MGYFSKSKKDTLGKLFEKKRFMDEAVLFITLSNSPLDKKRVKGGTRSLPDEYEDGFGTDDQHKIVSDYINELADMCDYKVTELATREYKSRNTPMLSMSYKVEAIK